MTVCLILEGTRILWRLLTSISMAYTRIVQVSKFTSPPPPGHRLGGFPYLLGGFHELRVDFHIRWVDFHFAVQDALLYELLLSLPTGAFTKA